MRKIIVFVLVLAAIAVNAQKPAVTNSFTVKGEVKTVATFALADLQKFKSVEIGDIVITNHLGEKKSVSGKMKGILLRDLLQTVEISAPSPKVLSEYYFVCKASDNYIVVYSWNELFNTAVGETAYIVTERDGLTIDKMDDSILMVSAKDFKTGRRQLKSLATIEVKRAN